VALWVAVFGSLTAVEARRAERPMSPWFVIGAIAGPIGLLLLRSAPPRRCQFCGTETRGWSRTCWWCREDVRGQSSDIVSGPARLVEPPPSPLPAPTHPIHAPIREVPDAAVPDAGSPRAPTTRPHTANAAPAAPAAPDPVARTPAAPAAPIMSAVAVGRGRIGSGTPAVRGDDRPEPIATAVYVTGTTNLEPGRRYGIALHGSRLQVLGPIDLDDKRIALERQVDALEARAIEGRFIMSDQRGWVVAFMAVGGIKPAELAELVAEAATGASLRSSQVVPLRQEG
jgi:hypothetical protein